MVVSELIERLKALPSDTLVLTEDQEWGMDDLVTLEALEVVSGRAVGQRYMLADPKNTRHMKRKKAAVVLR